MDVHASVFNAGAPMWPLTHVALVVDDEPAILRLAARMLKLLGFESVTACDGFEALKLCQNLQRPIALVLTDVTMPNMGGPEFAKHLARQRPKTPIVFMTGHSEERVTPSFNASSLAGENRGCTQAVHVNEPAGWGK